MPYFIPQKLIEAIQEGLSLPIKGAVMTMGEQFIQQGRGALFMHLLKEKFITIPESYKQQVEEADAQMLLKWSTQILKANVLEEVFA